MNIAQEPTNREHQELLAAAAETMRWLQDRAQHQPIEHQDPREARILRQLRTAIRGEVGCATNLSRVGCTCACSCFRQFCCWPLRGSP